MRGHVRFFHIAGLSLLASLLSFAGNAATAPGYCLLPQEMTLSAPVSGLTTALQDFRQLNSLAGITVRKARSEERPWLKLQLTDNGTPEHRQGWRMSIAADGIELAARTPEGLYNALQTLAVMIQSAPERKLRIGQQQSVPGIPERGVVFSVRELRPRYAQSLKRFIRVLGFLKYNRMFLEFGDNFPLPPDLFPRSRDCFTPELIRDFSRTAEEHFIQIVPTLRVWSSCPLLEGRSDRDEMLEVPGSSSVCLTYCPRHPKVQQLISRTVAAQCELLHPKEFFFRIDREELRHRFRQCPRCKNAPAEQLFAEHLAFLAKCAADANARPGFLLLNFNGICTDRLSASLPGNAVIFGISSPERSTNTADAGDPAELHNEILRSSRAGAPCFILRGGSYARNGEMTPIQNTSPWIWRSLVLAGMDMWSPDRPEPLRDPVGLFHRLSRFRPQPKITQRGIPIPIGSVLNADMGNVDGFPRFNDPAVIERMRKELAALPENFELAAGGGVHCYAALLAGESRDNRFPEKVTIPLGDGKAKYLALLLSCSPPLQQADFDPACRGKQAFKFGGIAYVTFNYTNGKSYTLNLRYMIHLTDWNRDFGGYRSDYAVTGGDQYGRFFHFDKLLLENPHPELPIHSFTFGSHRSHWLVPALLAASMIDAEDVHLPPEDLNAAISRISRNPPPRLNIPRIREIDFENGAAGKINVELVGTSETGASVRPQIDFPTDISSPSHNRVLRITVPPVKPKDGKPVELRINLPGELRSSIRSLGFAARIDHPEYLEGAFQILSDNRNNSYTQRFMPGKRWRRIWTSLGNPDLYSRHQLRDIYRSRMRRIVFRFRKLPEPVTVMIDDIGYSRWQLHTRPEVIAN